ncbi:Actin-like protein arp9 (SWI/SNF complex component arp9) [Allomyces javanicus]|nr:Actin-like protein arp9 (SWI/SNF complex component arp9) [Allomyces javanicus]
MALNKEERYVFLSPGSAGTLAGPTSALEPKCKRYLFDRSEDRPAPVDRGLVQDWDALGQHWSSVLTDHLGISKAQGDHPVFLLVPMAWKKSDVERAAKFLFETYRIPGLALAPEPVAALLGANAVTGLVVDIGFTTTTVTPIVETNAIRHAAQIVPVGTSDMIARLQALCASKQPDLNVDAAVAIAALKSKLLDATPPSAPLTAPSSAAAASKKAALPTTSTLLAELTASSNSAGASSADDQTSQPSSPADSGPNHAGIAAKIDPILRRQAVDDVLFTGAPKSLVDAMAAAVAAVEPAARASVMDAVLLTGGGGALIANLKERVQLEYAQQYLPVSTRAGEYQPREVTFRGLPEYLEAYQDHAEWAAYLGGSLLAKLMFPDTKSFVLRDEFDAGGASIVHTKAFGGISV